MRPKSCPAGASAAADVFFFFPAADAAAAAAAAASFLFVSPCAMTSPTTPRPAHVYAALKTTPPSEEEEEDDDYVALPLNRALPLRRNRAMPLRPSPGTRGGSPAERAMGPRIVGSGSAACHCERAIRPSDPSCQVTPGV